ncbi:hypothetical protein Ccrd_012928 [Cynara cardunculus var. scolymus]|uniref:Uncharacterized protein n=2 Tax=Cynara cardunculus var. scolymus TaxID=59895 RepID=A0A118K585_CYNCS|nr:hypothetical protein Ccrd_012928 [Cynara cardunculus var. scolymus]
MDGGARRNIFSNHSKDKDEDLSLFREMHKHRVLSLLHPVFDDFESNGNYPLYAIPSSKKGPGITFLGETHKNDYDW